MVIKVLPLENLDGALHALNTARNELINTPGSFRGNKDKVLSSIEKASAYFESIVPATVDSRKKESGLAHLTELERVLTSIHKVTADSRSCLACLQTASLDTALLQSSTDLEDMVAPVTTSDHASAKRAGRASTLVKIGDGTISNLLEMILKKQLEVDFNIIKAVFDGTTPVNGDAKDAPVMIKAAKAKELKGDYVESLYLYLNHRAVLMKNNIVASDTAETAQMFSRLGTLASRQENLVSAVKFYECELDVRKRIGNGPEDVAVAPTLHALAEVLLKQKKTEPALANLRKALKVRCKQFGNDHPTVAATWISIGKVFYSSKGKEVEALDAFDKALKSRELKHGPNHPGVASVHSSIGDVYAQQGKHSQALAAHQTALKIRQLKLSGAHPDIAHTHHRVAEAYIKLGKFDEAVTHYSKSYKIRKEKLGSEHPDTASSKAGMQTAQIGVVRPSVIRPAELTLVPVPGGSKTLSPKVGASPKNLASPKGG
jgi:tetratricopeptide (TPR) repeat protein